MWGFSWLVIRLPLLNHIPCRAIFASIAVVLCLFSVSSVMAADDPAGVELPKNLPPEAVQHFLGQAREKKPDLVLDTLREQGAGKDAGKDAGKGVELPKPKISHIERFYFERVGDPISQFGYAQFWSNGVDLPLSGAMADTYVLGSGDKLVVTLRGKINNSSTVTVDREGRILINELPPIPASGRTLGDLHRDILEQVEHAFSGTTAFVSLGAVRSAAVAVIGEVEKPGIKRMTGLGGILDALGASEGIKKDGTLRNIKIIRDGKAIPVDLYDVLLKTGTPLPNLREDDQVVVGGIGDTVAVTGIVNQPGIYELKPGENSISVAKLLSWSGGIIRTGNTVITIMRNSANGQTPVEVSANSQAKVQKGEILKITSGDDSKYGNVSLHGHVTQPQTRSLSAVPTLRALISNPRMIKPDPYSALAVIRRVSLTTRVVQPVPFNLAKVLNGEADMPLQTDDTVIVFSRDDIDFLQSDHVQNILSNFAKAGRTGCPPLDELAVILRRSNPMRFASAILQWGTVPKKEDVSGCPEVFKKNPELLPFLLEHSVSLMGEVGRPAVYPVVPPVTLAEIFDLAEGKSRHADMSHVEVARNLPKNDQTSLERTYLDLSQGNLNVGVQSGDMIRIFSLYSTQDFGNVVVDGEVMRPGSYSIRRGEKLSEVLNRAGGMSEAAFPFGTVFLRPSLADKQVEGLERMAHEFEASLLKLARGSATGGSNVVGAGETLIKSIRSAKPSGRMRVEADLAYLSVHPEEDVVLEPNDSITVPKRPSEISVMGAVRNPGSFQFKSGLDAAAYVGWAGGVQDNAAKDKVFVILPDGRAESAPLSSWQISKAVIVPGSTLVVPQDPTPFEFWDVSKDLTAILSQLALTAASVAVINR